MPKPPAIPGHLTQAEFGQTVMRWGTGDIAARARIQILTRVELVSQGITPQIARDWRDFYREISIGKKCGAIPPIPVREAAPN